MVGERDNMPLFPVAGNKYLFTFVGMVLGIGSLK